MGSDPVTRTGTSEARTVQDELQSILSGPSFRSSRRCSEFLRFVVQETLEGRQEDLKERTIGVSLFGRAQDYDTPGDPIVRVTANEVRKRLAQYYGDHGGDSLRIDLTPGSYVPLFRHIDPSRPITPSPSQATLIAPSPPKLPDRFPMRGKFVLWLLVAALAISGWALWHSHKETPLDAFWNPVLSSDRSPILCVGTSSHVWVLSDRLSAEFSEVLAKASQPIDVAINPYEAVAVGDGYFSTGSVKAALGLSAFLSQRGSQPQLRMAGPLSLDDFHNHTIVAVGAFSNPWTLERTSAMRFRFGRAIVDGKSWLSISDSQNPKSQWKVPESPFANLTVDYAVITRMIDPESKKVFLSLAGLNQFRTEAAEEFVTNPYYWDDLASHAQRGWQSRNIQVLIKTSVVELRPTPPQVIAVYFW